MADESKKLGSTLADAMKKALGPTEKSLLNIESGIAKVSNQGAKGAEERSENKRAEKASAAKQDKTNTLLGDMVKGIAKLSKNILDSVKRGTFKGIGILLAGITAPILVMVGFFKQLALEFKFLKGLAGGGLKKLFLPLKNLLMGEGKIAKSIKGSLKFIDKMHFGVFTKIGDYFKKLGDFFKGFQKVKPFGPPKPGLLTRGIQTIKNIIKVVGDFFKPFIKFGKTMVRFSKSATGIVRWASGFGKLLGKLFLPITILMSAFDFISGFMKGFKEDGIMGGLEGGLSELLKGLIGMPLDLLKDGVSWILEKFGFEQASEMLDSFSFSTLIEKMVKGFFDTIDGVVGWVKDTFSFGSISEALTSMMKLIWMPAILFKEWLVDPIVKWAGDIFGIDTSKFTEFDIFDHIELMIKDIGDFFSGLLDIDWAAAIKNLAPDWVKDVPVIGKFFGGGDDKPTGDERKEKKQKLKQEIEEEKAKSTEGGFLGFGGRDDEKIKELEAELAGMGETKLERSRRKRKSKKTRLEAGKERIRQGIFGGAGGNMGTGSTPQHKGIGGGGDGAIKTSSVHPSEGEGESDKKDIAQKMPPSWEKRSKSKVDTLLDTGMKSKVASLVGGMWSEHGVDVGVTSATRGEEEQNALEKKGVSKAKFGQSLHNYGAAVDLHFNTHGPKGIYDGPWDKLSSMGKGLGMRWGGDWKKFQDKPHFQINTNWQGAQNNGMALAAAKGFHGVVKGPTVFLTGEDGPEQVSITPMRDPASKMSAMNSLQNENAAGKMGNNAPTIINNAPQTINNSGGGGETYLPLPATVKHDKFDI